MKLRRETHQLTEKEKQMFSVACSLVQRETINSPTQMQRTISFFFVRRSRAFHSFFSCRFEVLIAETIYGSFLRRRMFTNGRLNRHNFQTRRSVKRCSYVCQTSLHASCRCCSLRHARRVRRR